MTDPAAAILQQAHRELAKLPDLKAKKSALAVAIDALMDAWIAADDAERRTRSEAEQMRQDARDIRRADRAA